MDWTRGNKPLAIAVIGPLAEVRTALDTLAGARIREFRDLFTTAAALAEFAPDVLLLGSATESHPESGPEAPGINSELDQQLGALRLLQGLQPDLTVLIVACRAELSARQREACAAHGVTLLDPDHDLQDLETRLSRALGGGEETPSYLEFVRGICDEINNPLMFASGHLQLLESRLDPGDDRDPLAQVVAIRQGLDRIQGTMRKVGAMGRATAAERQRSPFTVDDLVGATEEQIRAGGLAARVTCPDEARTIVLRGDQDLVSGALFGLCQVGAELNAEPRPVDLAVQNSTVGVAVRMEVANPRLEEWELPRAFEPYHLNEILRGTTLGLNLFLVRLVTRAHGWDAFARRLSGPRVEFCIGPAPVAQG